MQRAGRADPACTFGDKPGDVAGETSNWQRPALVSTSDSGAENFQFPQRLPSSSEVELDARAPPLVAMRATRVLRAARASRLVDTGYIKSAFIPVAQKVQLAYPGRDPDVQRVLGDAEQRFEQSLSLQVLAAPMERDIVSGLTLPRSLSLPLSWMSISRRLEAPAAIAAAKAIAEEEARAEAEAASKVAARAAHDTNTGPRDVVYDADAPNLRGDDDERVGAQGWKENKKARKARAANRAASMALQGPSMPWTAPAPIIKPRAKRKEVLENGERRWLTDPLETRRLRLNRARRTVLQMASAARKARAWTVWYDVVVVPQLSFAAAAPREEAHAWPQAQHTDIYFPHTKREWIFIHPTFVRSIFDTSALPLSSEALLPMR